VIEARGVGVRLGGTPILREATLAVEAGSIVAILGPNGAGKSTLLSVLAGLITPDAGDVRLDGRSSNDWTTNELARRRAYLPQRSELSFDYCVRDLVRIGRYAQPGRGDSAEDLVATDRALEAVGIADLADRRARSLSGGEDQRVRLARALAQIDGSENPRALLLDEPLASLDLAHQLALRALLRRLAGEGVAVALAAHELAFVAGFATRVVVLAQGEPPVVGEPEEVLRPDVMERVFGVRARVADGRLEVEP